MKTHDTACQFVVFKGGYYNSIHGLRNTKSKIISMIESPQLRMDESPQLIPSLPHEIAMTCLLRLPRRNRAIASAVSRAWRIALQNNSSIKSLRHALNLPPEFWIFIALFDTNCHGDYVHATQHNTKWLLLDPLTLQTLLLPNPLSAGLSIDMRLSSVATDNLLFLPEVSQPQKDGFCSYNMEGGRGERWQSIKLPPGQRCRRFACAEMNEFVYLSGGLLDLTRQASKSGFRYDTRTNQWETLPDMIMPRINCEGVAMNDKFFAIGGYYRSFGGFMQTNASAECFDPETGEWTLLPDFCANGLRYAENSDATELAFAVVEKKLYAMQPQSNEVMELDVLTEQWTHFGFVGGDCEMGSYNAINYKLLGVGSELWAIKYVTGMSIWIYSCNLGEMKRGSECRKWRQIEVAEMERFDHVLTCTTLKV